MDERSKAIVGGISAGPPLAFLAVCIRFYARRLRKMKPKADDLVILIALVRFLKYLM